MEDVIYGAPWRRLQRVVGAIGGKTPLGVNLLTAGTFSRPGIRAASLPQVLTLARAVLSNDREMSLPGQGSTAVPYAGPTRAQATCYAHQPLWSAASWKGQINHALILMGQKVPVFPLYCVKGLPYPPCPWSAEICSQSPKNRNEVFSQKRICPNNQP